MNISIKEDRFGIPIEWQHRHIFRKIILILGLVSLIVAITIGIQQMIKYFINGLTVTNDLNASWVSSITSYWGSIIGGVISGTLTVIGVAWTIKYYRDSDASKSRIENMPFLMAEVKSQIDKNNACNTHIKTFKLHVTKRSTKKENTLFYKIQLRNIGKGFASTLVVYTGENLGGIAFQELIQINENKEFCLEISSDDIMEGASISFAIRYIDCMTNEYIQSYSLISKGDLIIENGYPTFICQTHEIGKR